MRNQMYGVNSSGPFGARPPEDERRLNDARRRDAEFKRSIYLAAREIENLMRLMGVTREQLDREQEDTKENE
jgi:acetyl-CoA acetyltransferase